MKRAKRSAHPVPMIELAQHTLYEPNSGRHGVHFHGPMAHLPKPHGGSRADGFACFKLGFESTFHSPLIVAIVAIVHCNCCNIQWFTGVFVFMILLCTTGAAGEDMSELIRHSGQAFGVLWGNGSIGIYGMITLIYRLVIAWSWGIRT